ncbi:uncharacterized protein LOC123314910 [Coccinella septempunctata]|uniref:uncharacterized protein LOC123314910 n=1 Tax=Coccinella septempunctata TaxID=41139 RepID=UPI001D0931F7|nr:uncharacterized protein LOC123314910 [Coccinella septempunctata]
MSESEEDATSESDWPVSAEWLQNILRNHHKDLEDPAITIIAFNVKPGCDPSESVLSHIVAVSVEYCIKNDGSSDTHSLRLVIKMLPQDPFSRFFVTEAQFDLREIKFYTEVVPDLEKFKEAQLADSDGSDIKIPIPKCYYGHYFAGTNEPDPSPPESVLVLENIKSSGYACSDFSRGLTLKQTKAAVQAIAQIHALSLSYKVLEAKSLTDKYPFLFQTTRASDSYQQLIERGLPQLSQFLETRPGLADILAALNELRPHTKAIIESLLTPKEPLALITHTDFWCNNLMFKEDDSSCQCSILDWQMVTYSRATNDLALLLVSSVPAELRRLHTSKLLDNYWEILVSTCRRLGLDVETTLEYDRDQLERDYKHSQLLALLLCIGSVDLALGNAQMEERLLELLQDLHKDGLLTAEVVRQST